MPEEVCNGTLKRKQLFLEIVQFFRHKIVSKASTELFQKTANIPSVYVYLPPGCLHRGCVYCTDCVFILADKTGAVCPPLQLWCDVWADACFGQYEHISHQSFLNSAVFFSVCDCRTEIAKSNWFPKCLSLLKLQIFFTAAFITILFWLWRK